MSTKSTIKYGDDFHLYHEAFDRRNVYLSIDNSQFEATNNSITITIPKEIWAIIREGEPVHLMYSEMTDSELHSKVEADVDKRIKEYNEANDSMKGWLNMFGMLNYGLASDSRESQIKCGLDYFTKLRTEERIIFDKIESYKKEND